MVADKDGNLYGADQAGGGLNYDDGTIFELSRLSNGTWTETVLYTFTGLNDGDNPGADVTRDPATGTLYGTTEYVDGDQTGTIFQLVPPTSTEGTWTYNVLYTFSNPANGYFSLGPMLLTANGTLYGTAALGGAYGAGVVFSLQPPDVSGSDWTYTVLHSFSANSQGFTNGQFPEGSLAMNEKGDIFGATEGGITPGTVYELSPPSDGGAWSFRVLHSFSGSDGTNIKSGVVRRASDGVLFGGTDTGGTNNLGVVFELIPPTEAGQSWTEETLYSFTGSSDGCNVSGIALGPHGSLYGATAGLNCPAGSIFELEPPTESAAPWSFVTLAQDSHQPNGPLLVDKFGTIFGTEYFGGPMQVGAVYSVNVR